jgi:HSP20 family molecular chaperone IbpA
MEPERGYGQYERRFEEGYGYEQPRQYREHIWRGGIFGWLGSGIRASAAWVGSQMQNWGQRLGGRLKGTGEELGRAVRGRGEQMGMAMQERGEQRFRGYEGRPPRSYRRPDERILDDIYQRIALSGVDAEDVEIDVKNGVVTLSGRVPRRSDKRLIEEVAEQVFGAQEVQNHLHLAPAERAAEPAAAIPGGNGQGATYRSSPETRT